MKQSRLTTIHHQQLARAQERQKDAESTAAIVPDPRWEAYLRAAVSQRRGDDFYRAQAAFRGMTHTQMQEHYGQSRYTRQQILDGYREGLDENDQAAAYLESLIAQSRKSTARTTPPISPEKSEANNKENSK